MDLVICRPLREGVGRNPVSVARVFLAHPGRPLREGVGRNWDIVMDPPILDSRPLREGVGRN